ncbi:hypothetical protein SAMN05421641_102139 [Paracoccus thiocyanatus]|uniref:AAA+ family ATPase n=1 Tax=Paracoccus thiocyanatus TaxID=34006 RepID=A0A1N6NX45_9RHOB|nr:hypothetical protein [Paracoccus thiocyanatus]SIP96708.1 hypothetical protein SAMN05421641_102139 [Paracoccus thiocyanatus]
MRNLVLPALLCTFLAPAVLAQGYEPPLADKPPPAVGSDDGLEQGLDSFMRNLLDRAAPHLDRLGRDMGDTLGALAPVLQDIGKLMDDARHYHAPERLENGDILIRRRADAPPPPPLGDALRDMLRPAPPEDQGPGATPPADAPPHPLPRRDPENEIEL